MFVINNLQHEILFPAGLVPPHGDGRAFHILYLQRHIGVVLVWKKEKGNYGLNYSEVLAIQRENRRVVSGWVLSKKWRNKLALEKIQIINTVLTYCICSIVITWNAVHETNRSGRRSDV